MSKCNPFARLKKRMRKARRIRELQRLLDTDAGRDWHYRKIAELRQQLSELSE